MSRTPIDVAAFAREILREGEEIAKADIVFVRALAEAYEFQNRILNEIEANGWPAGVPIARTP